MRVRVRNYHEFVGPDLRSCGIVPDTTNGTGGDLTLMTDRRADVMMPDMGGVELAVRFREMHPDGKVLYISAHPFDELDLPDTKPPQAMYLAKPFTPSQLRSEARRALALPDETQGITLQRI